MAVGEVAFSGEDKLGVYNGVILHEDARVTQGYNPGTLAAIDTLKVRDLEPFWRLLAAAGRTTVVHAGREEMGFILHAIKERPARLFDVQVAAGLVDLGLGLRL